MSTKLMATLYHLIASRIVERISASVQKPVYVTDADGEITASSNGMVPNDVREIAGQAIAIGAIVRKPKGSGSSVALPLVHGGQIVGAIVVEAVNPQNDDVVFMARALAELIIHQMLVVEQLPHQTWAREKFLFDLFQGRLADAPDVALQEAALLDLDLLVPRVVVLVGFENGHPDTGAAVPQSALPVIEKKLQKTQREGQLIAFTQRVLDTRYAETACPYGNCWLAFLPAIDPHAADRDRHKIAHDLQQLLDRLAKEHNEHATVGVGRYYDGWPALAQSFADARFALEIGRYIHGAGQVYLPSNLGVASFVCSNDVVLKTQLAQHLVHRIVEEPELLHTIDVFLDANLSPSVAAERLHIHRHTLAHRLDKITRLTGLDPRQFHELAQLHAALVLYRTCMPSTKMYKFAPSGSNGS
jgi:carbohydrate diacid regulator